MSYHHFSLKKNLKIHHLPQEESKSELSKLNPWPSNLFLPFPSLFLLLFLYSLATLSLLSLFLIWPNQQGGMGGGLDLLFYLILLQIFKPSPCLLIATHPLHYSCPSLFVSLSCQSNFFFLFLFPSCLGRPLPLTMVKNLTLQFLSKLLNQS